MPENYDVNKKQLSDSNSKNVDNLPPPVVNLNANGVYLKGELEAVCDKTIADDASITDDTANSKKKEKPKALPMVGVFELVKIICFDEKIRSKSIMSS